MLATNKIIEYIDMYGDSIQLGGQFLRRAFIQNIQLVGALSTFAKGVNPDAVLAMVDYTSEQSGREGLLFSTSAVYFYGVGLPNKSVEYAMLRYADIVEAKSITDKISDFSNVMQIDIKNLPYDYYQIDSNLLRKKPLSELLNRIRDLQTEYDFEPDSSASIDNVRNYLTQKDIYFKDLYYFLENEPKVKTGNLKMFATDGFGLTPLHYCIAMKRFDIAEKILKESMKTNGDIYLKKQPFGVYSYGMCYMMANSFTSVDKGSGSEFFWLLNHYFDEIIELNKKLKIEQAKENIAAIAKGTWNVIKTVGSELLAQVADNYSNNAGYIADKYEEAASTSKNLYKGEMARQKGEEWRKKSEQISKVSDFARNGISSLMPSNDDEDYYEDGSYEEYSEEADYEESSYYDDSSDVEVIKGSDEVAKELYDKISAYANQCKKRIGALRINVKNGKGQDDVRFSVIDSMMLNHDVIKRRLEAENKHIIAFKGKYFIVDEVTLEENSKLKECAISEG